MTTTIPFAYVLAGVAVLAFGGAFTLQARRHAPPRALDAAVLRHARASRAATLLGSAKRRAEALASKRSALAAAKRDLQQATFAASETRTKADAHAQGWARFVAVKERAAAAKAAAEAAAAGAAAAAAAATGAREAVAAAFQRAQDAVKPRRGGEVITAEVAAARAGAANDKIEAAMDSGVFSSSERAAKKALAAAAALTEAVDARRAYEPHVSDDVRNALHAAAERAASDDLRAVDVARKHVEAAARARAGAYDYASSRAGGLVVNATAPPTLKSKARGFLKLEPGPSMVISSRAVDAARCWGFAGRPREGAHPAQPAGGSGILRGRTRAESARREAPRGGGAARVLRDRLRGGRVRDVRPRRLLLRRRRAGGPALPGQVPPAAAAASGRRGRGVRREQPGRGGDEALSLPGALIQLYWLNLGGAVEAPQGR